MNLPRIQALAAPLTAPIPSALGVAMEAYIYFELQSRFLGWVAAVGAFVGIETLGGASCYALIKLHRQRNYGVEFWLALAGIIAYVGSGWWTLSNSPVIIFFFLAPFSYFAYSILRSMEKEIEEKIVETDAQIKLINAQKNLINAETRRSMASVRPANEQSERANRNEQDSVREKVYAVLLERPDVGPREMARTVGCSVSTASKWIKEWGKQ